MNKIVTYFEAFNKSRKDYVASTTVIEFLDEKFPQWREEIKNPKEWSGLFNYDIHIYQNTWLETFAKALFDIIDDTEAMIYVWKCHTCNGFYRLAAIKKLREINEEKYLPQYIEELKAGNIKLGGWWLPMVDELFDFPGAIEVAIDMFRNSNDSLSFPKSFGLEYLAKNCIHFWNEYPQDIKDSIINEREYFILKNCTPQIWADLSQLQKFLLIHEVILNEYKYFNDIITINNVMKSGINPEHDETNLIFFYTSDMRMSFQDLRFRIRSNNRNRFAEPTLSDLTRTGFDIPQIDFRRLIYTPSEQLMRFDRLTNNPDDSALHCQTRNTINDLKMNLRHSSVNDF